MPHRLEAYATLAVSVFARLARAITQPDIKSTAIPDIRLNIEAAKVTFQDKFPNQIEFEFDRAAIRRISRMQAALLCFGLLFLFATLFSLSVCQEFLRANWRLNWQAKLYYQAQYVSIGVGIGLLISSAIYFGYFHRSAALTANNLRLIVEGPYLRLITGGYIVVDRRYHFRDIDTYTTIQGPVLRRFGLKTLTFRTQEPRSMPILVPGLKNPDQVRDLLCEIDATRTTRTDL